jgi:hypothetical protein
VVISDSLTKVNPKALVQKWSIVSVGNPSIVPVEKAISFIVPVAMNRHQKFHLWCQLLKWSDTKDQFFKKITEPRSRPVRARFRPYNLPPPLLDP